MGFLDRFERISEKFVEGLFKSKLNSRVQPVEIAKRLGREMANCKSVSVDKVYVPNEYEVVLSPADWQAFANLKTKVARELENFLLKKAAEKNYCMVAKPQIDFQKDESLAEGSFQVACRRSPLVPEVDGEQELSSTLQESTPLATGTQDLAENTQVFLSKDQIRQLAIQEKRAELVVIMGRDIGMTYRLMAGTSYLGRRGTNEIHIDDENLSRTHAEIQNKDGKYVVRDLESTNGTFVNGKRITQHVLMPGDHIRVGTTELEFRVVS